ncbi:hypothetical protein ACQ4M4_06200 [Leptolyngbya sp. AN02str]|uniref:hypothetical protein n=1 Tax=Leptolyngbya sp. AN02str TaxID=3423363 RepID=UPI003D31FBB7
MPPTSTKKRLPGSVLVGKSAIHQATSLLEQLPDKPKDQWSLREAIDMLREPIHVALDRGYSHDEVADMLADKGIRISVSSLKRYLAATRRTAPAGTKLSKTKRTRQSTAETKASTNGSAIAPAPETAASEPTPTPKKRGPRPKAATTAVTPAKTATKEPRTTSRTRKASAAPVSTRGRKKAT